jgi:hypothetical protein
MKFSTRNDIEAPIDFVFARASNFTALERQVMRRGVEVERTRPGDASGAGMAWKAEAKVRGRVRNFEAQVEHIDPPNGYTVGGGTEGLGYIATVETVELSPARTRIIVGLDLRPTTLTARLLLQSVKLAKSSVARKFDLRVAAFCQDIEDRYRAHS